MGSRPCDLVTYFPRRPPQTCIHLERYWVEAPKTAMLSGHAHANPGASVKVSTLSGPCQHIFCNPRVRDCPIDVVHIRPNSQAHDIVLYLERTKRISTRAPTLQNVWKELAPNETCFAQPACIRAVRQLPKALAARYLAVSMNCGCFSEVSL